MSEGLVFQIQRFCTHDGPGIRTSVFLKGCPLRCAWCHNPESQRFEPELLYTPALCIACGACAEACPVGAHQLVAGRHELDRALCRGCLRCAEACHARALEAAGQSYSLDAVLREVEADRVYYEETGGGLTVTGGEPLSHYDFAHALLAEARRRGIHTCIETSGYAPLDHVLGMRGVADLFLWDIKDTDPARHKTMTGVSLEPILDNLRRLDEAGGSTLLRCILVDGVNMTMAHIDAVAQLSLSLEHCQGVVLLPYHPMGNAKLERLGRVPSPHHMAAPTQEALHAAYVRLQERGVACLGS